jgi:hypothetical protein
MKFVNFKANYAKVSLTFVKVTPSHAKVRLTFAKVTPSDAKVTPSDGMGRLTFVKVMPSDGMGRRYFGIGKPDFDGYIKRFYAFAPLFSDVLILSAKYATVFFKPSAKGTVGDQFNNF